LIVFVSYLRAAYRPLRKASKTVQRSAKAMAAAERIVEFLEIEPDLKESPTAILARGFAGRIELRDVDFAYTPGRPVLRGISSVVEPGAKVVIMGRTGSGKSTLVSLVPRLFDPTAGAVTIDGTDVRDFTLESLRAQISVVQQESVLFGLSIVENIRYGRPDATDEQVQSAVEAAGLADVGASLPDGLDTVLTERGSSLSGGERRRVAIARALIRESSILILDEPTAGLDPAKRREVIDAIHTLVNKARTTTLLVTHDLQLAQDADEILIIDAGRLAARGSYTQLLTGSPVFRELLGDLEEPPGMLSRAQARLGAWGYELRRAYSA
jgi:ATP-binding cassette subfamily B protein